MHMPPFQVHGTAGTADWEAGARVGRPRRLLGRVGGTAGGSVRVSIVGAGVRTPHSERMRMSEDVFSESAAPLRCEK